MRSPAERQWSKQRGLERIVNEIGDNHRRLGSGRLNSSGGCPNHTIDEKTASPSKAIISFHAALAGAAWNEMTGLLGDAGILVNTTTLGMVGQPPLEFNLRCPASMVVADLVYDPLETALLASARARGLRTADGLGMLLHQAVRGFQLWFGVRPEVTPELRALVEADLLKKK